MVTPLADRRTLDVLDFHAIRERLSHETHSARATERTLRLEPETDFGSARRRSAETAEMIVLVASTGLSLERVEEVGPAIAAAVRGSTISAQELHAVAILIAAAASAVRRVREFEAPTLHALCEGFTGASNVAGRIDDAIGQRGEVLDRASPALARLRRGIVNAQDDARDRTGAIIRSEKYARVLQDAIVTVRDGRYVVPIKAEFSGEFPGIVHDSSASGHTLFVEPLAALESNNRLRALKMQEEHEVVRILAELSGLVGAHGATIERAADVYASLDVVAAKARVARAMNAVAPAFADDAVLDVRAGRHPLLGERGVPQSLRLDGETRLIVISGPNMGGKTVALKMAGLFTVMAYCGLHVPAAEGTTVGHFTRLFTDIGDDQSIAQNTSTFSAHLRRLAEIVTLADERSLVLIDEIGSGTEPNAGAALAVAILERFVTVGARAIATTHATELKLFAHESPHVQNASVRFDPQTYAPTYELDLDSPGQSLAFALARSMRLDSDVVERAETLLSRAERDYDRAVAELADLRMQAAAERDALAAQRQDVRSAEEALRRQAEAIENERRVFAREADERLARALREFTAELARRANEHRTARPRVTSGQSALLSRTIDQMHRELGIEQKTARDGAPTNLEPGDRVKIVSLDQDATVVQDLGQHILVSIGSMRSTVAKADVQRSAAAPARKERRGSEAGAAKLEAASGARTEIDVRGKRYAEAEPLVEAWIDESMLAGYSPLRLIHGKGTGLLGRGLQQFLRANAYVKNVRYGNEDEGGSGVTVFELR